MRSRSKGAGSTYRNRFVETPGKGAEDGPTADSTAGSPREDREATLDRFRHRNDRKNPANTNVVFHAGKLLALCEAGRPYRLDPRTLSTVGEDDMGGTLPADAAYSAHPKLDRATGEMWNFGTAYGTQAPASLYRTSAQGETRRVGVVPLPRSHGSRLRPHPHAGHLRHRADRPAARPAGARPGQRSFAESLRWQPELGVNIAVVDRSSGEIRWARTDPFMMFHTVHAWDEGDDVVVDLCAYADGAIMQTIEDVMVGDVPTPARAYAERLRISPTGTIRRSRLSDMALEFPRVAGRVWGRAEDRIYGTAWTDRMDFIGRPVAIDTVTGKVEQASFGDGELAGECVPVSKGDARSERDVWLLTLVFDGAAGTTELRILDGGDVSAPPVARIALPHVVPLGFHGNWVSRERLAGQGEGSLRPRVDRSTAPA